MSKSSNNCIINCVEHKVQYLQGLSFIFWIWGAFPPMGGGSCWCSHCLVSSPLRRGCSLLSARFTIRSSICLRVTCWSLSLFAERFPDTAEEARSLKQRKGEWRSRSVHLTGVTLAWTQISVTVCVESSCIITQICRIKFCLQSWISRPGGTAESSWISK